MLVIAITRLFGVTDTVAKGIIVILFGLLAGLLVALFPNEPWVAPVAGAITAIAALIDPNAGHSST